MQKVVQTKAQLLSQSNENEMVAEELARLDESASVFKLIGPALVKQDPAEAKANVAKRLEYIRGEAARVDRQLKALQEKGAARQQEVRAALVGCVRCVWDVLCVVCGVCCAQCVLCAACWAPSLLSRPPSTLPPFLTPSLSANPNTSSCDPYPSPHTHRS